MRRGRSRSVSKEKYWSSHLERELFHSKAAKATGRYFKQEATEETENARTDALRPTVDISLLLSPLPPVQNFCFEAFMALL
jgi:hypothetical protein